MTDMLKRSVCSVGLALLLAFSVAGAAMCAEPDIDLDELGREALTGDPRKQCDYAIACALEGDTTEAFRWFLKAAEQGLPEAQYEVGYAYANGIGVSADPARSVIWYGKAAQQGNLEAMFQLGLAYYDGLGTEVDYELAVQWFAQAADAQHPAALCGLGWMHLEGAGVLQDTQKAYVFLNMAVAKLSGEDREMCAGLRDEAASKLTPEMLAAAQGEAAKKFEGIHVTRGTPDVSDISPIPGQELDPEEEAFQRRKELERMRFQHEMRLQRQQMRDLKRLERIRNRRYRD